MKNFITAMLMAALLFPVTSWAKKKDVKEGYVTEYHMEGAGMLSSNENKVRVTILTKKKDDVTDAMLQNCAVHGILFRGYSDATNAGYGAAASHKAVLGPTAETQYADFFQPFFENGDATRYSRTVSDTRRVIKAGKLWKVSAEVTVSTTQLRDDLKKQNVGVKDLGSGW